MITSCESILYVKSTYPFIFILPFVSTFYKRLKVLFDFIFFCYSFHIYVFHTKSSLDYINSNRVFSSKINIFNTFNSINYRIEKYKNPILLYRFFIDTIYNKNVRYICWVKLKHTKWIQEIRVLFVPNDWCPILTDPLKGRERQ